MKKRGLIASLLAVAMCVSMSTVAFADGGTKGVYAGKLHDTRDDDSQIADEELFESYDVQLSGTTVTVTAAGLKEHQNGQKAMGYWVGVLFKAPDDATHVKMTYGGTGSYEGEIEKNLSTQSGNIVNGISIYYNAKNNSNDTITITWKNGDGGTTDMGFAETYTIDLSGVKLYGQEEESKPTTSTNKSSSSKRENPLDAWSGDVFEMENAVKGDMVKVNLATSNGKIPGSLVEALNDSEATLEFTYGSLKYTVNPGDIEVESGRIYWPLDLFLELLNGLKK